MATTTPSRVRRIRIGVSACLLGAEVSFDGGHKHDRFLTDVLGRHAEWVPVCPEVELGLGVPRDTLRLEGTLDAPRRVQEKTGEDLTARTQRYSQGRARELTAPELDGYVVDDRLGLTWPALPAPSAIGGTRQGRTRSAIFLGGVSASSSIPSAGAPWPAATRPVGLDARPGR